MYEVVKVKETPDEFEPGIAYLIGEFPFCFAFICPCNCRGIIYLPLVKDSKPCWEVKEVESGVYSVTPSIKRIRGCNAHFYFERNKIRYA